MHGVLHHVKVARKPIESQIEYQRAFHSTLLTSHVRNTKVKVSNGSSFYRFKITPIGLYCMLNYLDQ